MHKTVVALAVALGTIMPPCGAGVTESDFALNVEDKDPPEAISEELRAKIVPKAYQISDADGLFFEFWFVPELTVSAIADTTKKTLDNVEEISLIGAMIVYTEDHMDFRDDPIDPGTYVLRMALQPQNGDHMGTSPYDTFAILMPFDKDDELKEYPDHEYMVELASEDTIAEHPPILALQPMDSLEGEFPRLHKDEEKEWDSFCMKFPVKAGDESTVLPLFFVFEGIGEL